MKPSDVWYSSCVDLVNSRFFQGDFQAYGISDLKVNQCLYFCTSQASVFVLLYQET